MSDEVINGLLSRLESYSEKLSHVEKENVAKDLSLILNFIDSGEYQSTELFHRNRFDTQKRTYEFFSYIKGYVQQATQWYEFLQHLPLAPQSSILDIGPGYSPKVELALKFVGFKGKLTVLDKSASALIGLQDFLGMVDFPFELNVICDDLFAVKNVHFNLVTANHLFDDLLMDAYCTLEQIPLQSVYESETSMIDVTSKITQTFDTTSLSHKIVLTLGELVQENGFLLLRHYQGLTEKALELTTWYAFVTLFFENVVEQFRRRGFSILEKKDGFVLLVKNHLFKKDIP